LLRLGRADFSSLNLYMVGPQDPARTVTALKMLNASADRSKRPHHYIDLKTNPDVVVKGNTLIYKLRPVTDEAPGTYRLSLNTVLDADAIQQVMKFSDIQIGTAEPEKPVVTKSQCATCHEGPMSGKMYLHHVDPGRSPTGSWALDYQPVESCKSCHNNDGYASIKDATGATINDPIIRRVHGVHMGEELKLDFHTNAVTGDFRHYTHTKFPADARNCKACHVDDRYKTAYFRLACTSCHDNVWFGAKDALPTGQVAHPLRIWMPSTWH
jgi:OmcA/MtrC family decaheme c-type cytochrome